MARALLFQRSQARKPVAYSRTPTRSQASASAPKADKSTVARARPSELTDPAMLCGWCAKQNVGPFRSRRLWRGVRAGKSATYFSRPSPTAT